MDSCVDVSVLAWLTVPVMSSTDVLLDDAALVACSMRSDIEVATSTVEILVVTLDEVVKVLLVDVLSSSDVDNNKFLSVDMVDGPVVAWLAVLSANALDECTICWVEASYSFEIVKIDVSDKSWLLVVTTDDCSIVDEVTR